MSAALFTAYLQYRQDCFTFHRHRQVLTKRPNVLHFHMDLGEGHSWSVTLPLTTVTKPSALSWPDYALQIEITRPALDGESRTLESGTE